MDYKDLIRHKAKRDIILSLGRTIILAHDVEFLLLNMLMV